MMGAWLRRLWGRLFGPRCDDAQKRPRAWPSREQIERLAPFEALDLDDIEEIATPRDARRATEALKREAVVGFDTESQPTFVKGQVSTGPHVAQFSTLKTAYIFMLHNPETLKAAADIIAAEKPVKVGFGLNDDLRRIPIKMGVQPRNVVDLESEFAARGWGRGVGVKVGVAIALKRRFMKSKRASTSNWKARRLTDRQLLYAANDAFAPVRVYHALPQLKHRR